MIRSHNFMVLLMHPEEYILTIAAERILMNSEVILGLTSIWIQSVE